MIAANAFFTYNVFRINSHWRASTSASTLQRLLDCKSVTWTPSTELERLIVDQAEQFSSQLAQNVKLSTNNNEQVVGKVWKWDPNRERGDLHDAVITRLQALMKLPELIRTYRRTRMQYFVHQGKD